MENRMQNRLVLVTGAGQGIGLAAVNRLVEQGARVLAADRNSETLDSLSDTPRVTPVLLDVTDGAAVSEVARSHPGIDTLVNCAGYVANGTLLECSAEEFELAYQVNLFGIFTMIKNILPNMLARKKGNIINLASTVSTVKAAPSRFAYSVFKGGVIALTKSVALDYIKQGIRCNAISPGTIDSPSLQQRLRDTGDYAGTRATFIARQPMGRLGLPDEVAAAVVFLASDEVGFLTGENIIIDGGFTL
ncbi:SDR family oxidoreductase [Exilibacterium tricleocarpae]|uniref:SDR family oxidoreductase n=1 Tax=Exilibacterium tricleocarpae TaxID=2591008 RepID=A0A545TSA4_9GAMM|nr:SDR family oxidoreductase [Exilibacterium tricleocarpae]TQV80100.1 SDR family oxidoreductase [Exilibacterium tricleocarpae]